MLEFISFSKHTKGLIFSLLSQSYAEYFRHDPGCESDWKRGWRDYDRAVFEYPETVGKCGIITTLNQRAMGFSSWDPRRFPVGVMGHNCILPAFRGNSYGTQQIREVLKILADQGFHKVEATTGEHVFFRSAQRMYQACGFREVGRGFSDEQPPFRIITYEHRFARDF